MLALSATFLASFAPSAHDGLVHAPRAGDEWTVRYTERSRQDAVHLRIDSNGQVTDRTDYLLTLEHDATRTWTDEVVAEGAGRPARWTRTFGAIGHEVELDILERNRPVRASLSGSSDLTGRKITFDWNADEERYVPDWADETDTDAELLGAVRPTPTFAELLPPEGREELTVGASWNPQASALVEALQPSGPLSCAYPAIEGAEDPDLIAYTGALAISLAAGETDGEVTATWQGVVPDSDGTLARIALEFELESQSDVTDWMRAQCEPHAMAMVGKSAEDARVTSTLTGTGELVWNLAARRFERMHLEAESGFRLQLDFAFRIGDFEIAGDYALTTEGTTAVTLTTE